MRRIRVPNGIGGLDNLYIGFFKQLSGDLEARLLQHVGEALTAVL